MKSQANEKFGFTLVELMVVVAIISLLAALAIPQYKNFVVRSKRVQPITQLMAVHKGQMTYFATYDQFYPPNAPVGDSLTIGPASAYNALGLEDLYANQMGWGYYTFHASGPNSGSENRSVGYLAGLWQNFDEDAAWDTWEIRMTPTNSLAGDRANCPVGVPYMLGNDLTNYYSLTCS